MTNTSNRILYNFSFREREKTKMRMSCN